MKRLVSLILLSSFLTFSGFSQEKLLKKLSSDLNGDGIQEIITVYENNGKPHMTIIDGKDPQKIRKFSHFSKYEAMHLVSDKTGNYLIYLTEKSGDDIKGFEIRFDEKERAYINSYKIFTLQSHPDFFN